MRDEDVIDTMAHYKSLFADKKLFFLGFEMKSNLNETTTIK